MALVEILPASPPCVCLLHHCSEKKCEPDSEEPPRQGKSDPAPAPQLPVLEAGRVSGLLHGAGEAETRRGQASNYDLEALVLKRTGGLAEGKQGSPPPE